MEQQDIIVFQMKQDMLAATVDEGYFVPDYDLGKAFRRGVDGLVPLYVGICNRQSIDLLLEQSAIGLHLG
jgi:hypothetical protein